MLSTGSLFNKQVLIVLITTIIAFSPVFNANFVNYDDPEHVINNNYIQKISVDNVKAILHGDACVLYIPITILSYYLDFFLGGNTISFHSVNLFLHLLNILLLCKLVQLLKLSQPLIFLILIFFALNPVITESVCWVTERKDVLYTFFLLCTAIFFYKDQQQNLRKYYYASLIFFILSCLSKPMAVSFPIVASVYLYTNNALKTNLLKLLPFLLVTVFISFITYYFVVIKNGPIVRTNYSDYSTFQKSFLFMSKTGFYFVRYLLPLNISLFYFFPKELEFYNFTVVFCFVSGLTYFFFLYYFRNDKRIMGLLISWLIMLLPVMQIVPNSQSYANERYFYLTLTLPVYFVGLFIQKLFSTNSLFFLFYSLLLIFATLTYKQAQRWRSSETLFQYELSLNNNNLTALSILGSYYNGIGEFQRAKPYFVKALAIDPVNATCLNNYGWCLNRIGKPDSSIIFLKRAILHKKNFLEAHNNLGVCYLNSGENEKAIEEFKVAESINHNHPDVQFNLGVCYFFNKEEKRGINYLQNAAAKGHKKAKHLLKTYKLESLH